MEVKKDILWRTYLVYLAICVFGLAILVRVFTIQFSQGEKWKTKAKNLTTRYFDIEAVRGNIFDVNGSLLATSLPYYEVGMDVNTDFLISLSKNMFNEYADSLAQAMHHLFKDKAPREYYQQIVKARKDHDRYIVLKRNVSYKELQEVKKFPLFRMGRNRGGFVFMQINKRERPFRILAARTIGYERKGIKPIGLEGAYDSLLQGKSGSRLMRKIAGGVWMPLNNDNEVEPEDGADLYTTIDINIQDVAEHALLTQLKKHNAGYGCVILMEVKTGEVKAIANLSRQDTSYAENYNNAIGSATEPGSTFKLASYLAAFEDGYADLDDKVNLEDGTCKYYDRIVRDSHPPEEKMVSVKRAFEISSNVGVSKIITKYYSKDPQKFIDRLNSFGLNTPLNLSIPGEGKPKIKNTKDKSWSGTTLPWMSHGYEVLMSPIQILTFYNAVANDGRMVKPMFVKEVRKRGRMIKKYNTEVLNESICSNKSIQMAKEMLEGVVQNGTAKNLKATSFRIAGKTGTAQIANKGIYKNGTKITYQASFVGYFPADNPKYSCIVIVNAPSNDVYYGNVVAGPIFKEIADKVYSSSLEIHKEINSGPIAMKHFPEIKSGLKYETKNAAAELGISVLKEDIAGEWLKMVRQDSAHVKITSSNVESDLKKGIVPDLTGMMIQDAIYILENNGMSVTIKGRGKIKSQSLQAGTSYNKGAGINLFLSDI